MLPATNVVPSGILSFTITSCAKSPLFCTLIVYVIFSPSTTYPKPFSVFISLLAVIIGSTYLWFVSFVVLLFTVATFFIVAPLSKSFTFTLNSISLLSPAPKFTVIPFFKSSAVLVLSSCPPIFILPVTNVVPVGILSFTVATVGAFPSLLSKWIVYIISSPAFTVLPLAGLDVLLYFKFALFTVVVTAFISSSWLPELPGFLFTVAWFVIVFVNILAPNVFTVTSKLTVVSPDVLPCFAGTFSVIPFDKSCAVLFCCAVPFTLILPVTNVVPSGILSLTRTSCACPPLFFTLIVYVIFSPSTTYPNPCSVFNSLLASIIGPLYVFVIVVPDICF